MAIFRFLLANSLNNIQRLICIRNNYSLVESRIVYHLFLLKNINLISKYVGIAFSYTSSNRYIYKLLQNSYLLSFTVSYLFLKSLLMLC